MQRISLLLIIYLVKQQGNEYQNYLGKGGGGGGGKGFPRKIRGKKGSV